MGGLHPPWEIGLRWTLLFKWQSARFWTFCFYRFLWLLRSYQDHWPRQQLLHLVGTALDNHVKKLSLVLSAHWPPYADMEIMLYGSAGSLTGRQREIGISMYFLHGVPQACLQLFPCLTLWGLKYILFNHFRWKTNKCKRGSNESNQLHALLHQNHNQPGLYCKEQLMPNWAIALV